MCFYFADLQRRDASKDLEPNHMHKQVTKTKILQMWKLRPQSYLIITK